MALNKKKQKNTDSLDLLKFPFPPELNHTFVFLDGEHGQSIDDFIGGQRSTQGRAKDILEIIIIIIIFMNEIKEKFGFIWWCKKLSK